MCVCVVLKGNNPPGEGGRRGKGEGKQKKALRLLGSTDTFRTPKSLDRLPVRVWAAKGGRNVNEELSTESSRAAVGKKDLGRIVLFFYSVDSGLLSVQFIMEDEVLLSSSEEEDEEKGGGDSSGESDDTLK